jgi:hypothetical protein
MAPLQACPCLHSSMMICCSGCCSRTGAASQCVPCTCGMAAHTLCRSFLINSAPYQEQQHFSREACIDTLPLHERLHMHTNSVRAKVQLDKAFRIFLASRMRAAFKGSWSS